MVLLALAMGIFSGCGGGGGGSGSAPPTKAEIKLSVKDTLSTGKLVGGVDVSMILPTGVSAKTINSSTTKTDTGVVQASGGATGLPNMTGTYTSSTRTVRILFPTSNGFPAGQFATINADIATGSAPVAADFNQITAVIKDFTVNGVADYNGAIIEYSVVFK